jgi:hypothetical protein
LAGSFDSEEPFWIRNTVSTTYAAIWRYSLSQFSVRASQNDPLVAYSPSDISGSPCARRSSLWSRKPVNSRPTMKMAASPKHTSDKLFVRKNPDLAGFEDLSRDRGSVSIMTGSYPDGRPATRTTDASYSSGSLPPWRRGASPEVASRVRTTSRRPPGW